MPEQHKLARDLRRLFNHSNPYESLKKMHEAADELDRLHAIVKPLLDRDPALVERVAKAVMEIGNDPWLTGIVQQVGMRKATAALTAILTPPEAEK